MSQLEITQRTESSIEILITLADKTMAVNCNQLGDQTEIVFSSSASKLVFVYINANSFELFHEMAVQNIYQIVYKDFIELISEDANYYQDGTQVPYNVSQAFRAYRRNLPEINLFKL
jgi:hypothetical protein